MGLRTALALVGTATLLSSCLAGAGVMVQGSGDGAAIQTAPPPAPPVHTEAAVVAEPGPPPWAPAHGRRRKDAFRYRYYETAQVYHDPERALYFHLDLATGEWQMSVTLPSTIKIGDAAYVELDMDSDKPYAHHDEVRKKYPPGQAKKKGKGKKGKGSK